MKNTLNGMEALLWSIGLPGFGQFLNKKYVKGIILILLEFIINIKANINTIIVLSFFGHTETAVSKANYQWLLFYPCIYMFSIWDAYRDAREKESPLLFLPFAFAAYIETIAVVYSSTFRIRGILLGPIFLPMISIFVGLGIGFIIRHILLRIFSKADFIKIRDQL